MNHAVDELLDGPDLGGPRPVFWLLFDRDCTVLGLYEHEGQAVNLAFEHNDWSVAPVVLGQFRGTSDWPGLYRPKVEVRPGREVEQVYRYRTTLGIDIDERQEIG